MLRDNVVELVAGSVRYALSIVVKIRKSRDEFQAVTKPESKSCNQCIIHKMKSYNDDKIKRNIT